MRGDDYDTRCAKLAGFWRNKG